MTVGLQAVIGDSLGTDELTGGGSLFCLLLCFLLTWRIPPFVELLLGHKKSTGIPEKIQNTCVLKLYG
mgnify:CR=1 FL=1